MTKNQKSELAFNLCLIGFLTFFFSTTFKFREVNISKDMIGTSGFPKVIIFLTLGIVLFQTYKLATAKTEEKVVKNKNLKKSFTAVLLILGYIILLNYVGYLFITPFAIIALAYSMGYKNMKMLIFFSVIVTAVLVGLFGIFFSVPLPRGILFFRELSYYVY